MYSECSVASKHFIVNPKLGLSSTAAQGQSAKEKNLRDDDGIPFL